METWDKATTEDSRLTMKKSSFRPLFIICLKFLFGLIVVLGSAFSYLCSIGSTFLLFGELSRNSSYIVSIRNNHNLSKGDIYSQLESSKWIYILYIQMVPEIHRFLTCAYFVTFRQMNNWNVKSVIIIPLVEIIDAIGLVILITFALPGLDFYYSTALQFLNILPLYRLVTSISCRYCDGYFTSNATVHSTPGLSRPAVFCRSHFCRDTAVLLSCLISISAVGIFFWRITSASIEVCLCLALYIIISQLKHIFNHTDLSPEGSLGRSLKKMFPKLQEQTDSGEKNNMFTTYLVVSMCRAIVFVVAFPPTYTVLTTTVHSGEFRNQIESLLGIVCLVQLGFTFLAKYLSQISIRTNLQLSCFFFLLLGPLSAFMFGYVLKLELYFRPGSLTYAWVPNYPSFEGVILYPLIVLVLAMISFLLVNIYIWEDNSVTYALERNIFALPGYRTFNIGIEQMLNRVVVDKTPKNQPKSSTFTFVCTTLWHETEEELETLIRSLLRLIRHRNETNRDYNFEINIFFDDAFQVKNSYKDKIPSQLDINTQKWKVLNPYVNRFIGIFKRVLLNNQLEHDLTSGHVFTAPYGGRLVYYVQKIPFIIHFKDSELVQRGKRWSQIMYMYYLLGWKMDTCKMMSNGVEVRKERTFILALDGDVNFEPCDFELVHDRLCRNTDVAACCNQIHPSGKGPLVMFQRFEYAVGHWFAKSAEHTLGCVLCSPGCFSLIRVSNLMQANVMATYKSLATGPMEKIMYDQGEDRWLCTLLLISGGRIEFEAGSHCKTFAPEDLATFYKQRRRWGPSTLVNLYETLSKADEAVNRNRYITRIYIVYQTMILALSLISIAMTLMVLWEALDLGFDGQMSSYSTGAILLIPVFAYMCICFKCKSETQLSWAFILSLFYSVIMIVMVIAIAVGAGRCPINMTLVFLIFLIVIHVIAGILHLDFQTLLCGLVYLLMVPSNFIFLPIYMYANVNDVTWGTRVETSNNITENKSIFTHMREMKIAGICHIWNLLLYGPQETDDDSNHNDDTDAEGDDFESDLDKTSDEVPDFERRKSSYFCHEDFEEDMGVDEDTPGGRLRNCTRDDTYYSPFTIYGGTKISTIRSIVKRRRCEVLPKGRHSDNLHLFNRRLPGLSQTPAAVQSDQLLPPVPLPSFATDVRKFELMAKAAKCVDKKPPLGYKTGAFNNYMCYDWVPDELEDELNHLSPTGKEIRQREFDIYKTKLNYSKFDVIWVNVGNKVEFRKRKDASKLMASSSYLSWILDDLSEIDPRMPVYSLPFIEYNFWAKIINLNDGYLRVVNNSGDKQEVAKNEALMREELRSFRNTACKAIVFINLLFLVLAVGLKIKADDLPQVPITIKLGWLPWVGRNFRKWQLEELDCGKLFCNNDDYKSAIANNARSLKCYAEFSEIYGVIVNGSYHPPDGQYAQGCPLDDENCEDMISFRFPAFNLLFLALYIILLSIQMLCMLKQRFSTLLHVVASINLVDSVKEWRKINRQNRLIKLKQSRKKDDIRRNSIFSSRTDITRGHPGGGAGEVDDTMDEVASKNGIQVSFGSLKRTKSLHI